MGGGGRETTKKVPNKTTVIHLKGCGAWQNQERVQEDVHLEHSRPSPTEKKKQIGFKKTASLPFSRYDVMCIRKHRVNSQGPQKGKKHIEWKQKVLNPKHCTDSGNIRTRPSEGLGF